MKKALLVVAVTSLLAAVASCAASQEEEPQRTQDTSTVPSSDAGHPADADPDACSDPNGCAAPVDCTLVDFCPVAFPVSRLVSLNAVWGSGPNDVWAVGTRGTVLHGDGSTFTPVPVPVEMATDIFVAVWGTSATDVWILGPSSPLHSAGHAGEATTLEPRQGSSWDPSKSGTGRLWTGRTAGARVWLGGEPTTRFGAQSSFFRLADDGSAWTGVAACTPAVPCTPAVRAMWAADASTLWAVGRDGQAFFYDDAAADARWLPQNSNTREDLEGVWGSGPNDVWAVGRRGAIRHTARGAQTWTTVASPTTQPLHAVWGSSPTDVWAVGDAGTVLHFDGTTWSVGTIGIPNGDLPTDLLGIWGSGPDDVWIVGEGVLYHRTAASRRQVRR